jgi:hypothetical protein
VAVIAACLGAQADGGGVVNRWDGHSRAPGPGGRCMVGGSIANIPMHDNCTYQA